MLWQTTKRFHGLQPDPGAQINWTHPLTSGIIDAMLFNGMGGSSLNLTNAEFTTTAGSGSAFATTLGGKARSFNSSGRDKLSDLVTRRTNDVITVMVGFVNDHATSDASFRSICNRRADAGGTGGVSFGLNFKNSVNTIQWYWATVGPVNFQVVSTTSKAITPTVPHQIVGTRSSTTAGKLWLDGLLLASGTGLRAGAANATTVNFGACADGTEGMSGKFLYYYLWNRELTANEIASLSADPYQFFIPEGRYPSVGTATSGAFLAAWANRNNQLIGGGHVS